MNRNISLAVLAGAFAGVADLDSVDPVVSSTNQATTIGNDHESSSSSSVTPEDEVVDFSSITSENEIQPECDDSSAMDATRLGQPLRNFVFLSFLVNISRNKDAFFFQLYAVDSSSTDLSLV